MVVYFFINKGCRLLLIICLVLLASFLGACGCEEESGPVSVTFEIQLFNARAYSYSYGFPGGEGVLGSGKVNETIRETYSAHVGDEVFVRVNGTHWDSSQPSHEILCRILVHGEEIYIDADHGDVNRDTEAICRGPVYIPKTPE
jgi:hypothetical protein